MPIRSTSTSRTRGDSYNKMFVAYLRTFARMGLKAIPMAADTGPIGGDLSHEFIILADTGESQVYCHRDLLGLEPPGADHRLRVRLVADRLKTFTGKYAATDEKHDAARFAKEVPEKDRVDRARHRGRAHLLLRHQIFGSRWAQGARARTAIVVTVQMGSYGIGVSRLVGAIIEASHDEAGIIWPRLCRALRCRPDQSEGRRRRDGRGLPRSSMQG